MKGVFGTLSADLGWGVRVARRSPGITAFAIVSLSIGLGASTALFAAVQVTLTASGTLPRAREIVTVRQRNPKLGIISTRFAPANYFALVSQGRAFRAIGAYRPQTLALEGGISATTVTGAAVTPSFFDVAGVRPERGRVLNAPDVQSVDANGPILSTGDNVVISHNLWRSRFGSTNDIVGRRVRLDEHSYTVVGVMPASFDFPRGTDVWLPLGFSGMARFDEGGFALEIIARLKAGISPEQAQADLNRVSGARQKAAAFNAGMSFPLRTIQETLTSGYRRPLILLFVTACLVVGIIAVNLAAALLARTTVREHEIAIRTALGASRGDIVRGVVAEGVVLAWLGGLFACGVASAVLQLLRHFAPPQTESLSAITINAISLIFTVSVATLLGAGIGVLPALRFSAVDVQSSLASAGAGRTTSRRQRRWQDALLIGQLGIAVALIDGTLLLYRSYVKLQSTPLGFANSHVLAIDVDLPRTRYSSPDETARFAASAAETFVSRGGAQAGAAALRLPVLDEPGGVWLKLSNFGQAGAGLGPEVTFNAVAGQYFKSLGIPLVAGRDFGEADGADGALVAIVSQSLAQQTFGRTDVLNREIVFSPWPTAPRRIVGIVGDTRQGGWAGPMANEAYIPLSQVPMFLGTHLNLVFLPHAVGEALSPQSVASLISTVDRGAAVGRISSMGERLSVLVAPLRFATILIGLFGCLGLLLAMTGVAGVTSHIVASRKKEIGICMALGAEGRHIARLVVMRSLACTGAGVAIGLALAAAGSQAARSLVPGLVSFDVVSAAATAGTAGLVALLAVARPLRDALATSPLASLRDG